MEKNNKVLIHCTAGKSRSATIFMAYTMKYHRLSYEEAYKITLQARPKIKPNIGTHFIFRNLHFSREANSCRSTDFDFVPFTFSGFQDQLSIYESAHCKVTPDLLEKCSSTHFSIRQFPRPSKLREFPKTSEYPLLTQNEKSICSSKEEEE